MFGHFFINFKYCFVFDIWKPSKYKLIFWISWKLVTLVEQIAKIPNWFDYGSSACGQSDSLPGVQALKIHETDDSGGASPVGTCQTVNQDWFSTIDNVFDEFKNRLEKVEKLLCRLASMAFPPGYVKGEVIQAAFVETFNICCAVDYGGYATSCKARQISGSLNKTSMFSCFLKWLFNYHDVVVNVLIQLYCCHQFQKKLEFKFWISIYMKQNLWL